jgi:phosphoribosyl 1,2-cyclic phosphodiesterase
VAILGRIGLVYEILPGERAIIRAMLVRFWGVRGSVPWSRRESAGFGCNTPCVEVRDEQTGALLILDAGTGVIGLGEAAEHAADQATILLSHYHWDHVQGLPFFAPFFRRGSAVTIHAPALAAASEKDVDAMFDPPHFPVSSRSLASPPDVRRYESGEIRVAGFHVTAARLNHPGGAFAFRVRGATSDLVYASDHEFGDPEADERLAAFALNSGATILDAQFTPDELPSHAGWGHASWRQCAEFASATGAGHLWLFHHRPGRADSEMEAIEGQARRVYPATRAAREGDVFSL